MPLASGWICEKYVSHNVIYENIKLDLPKRELDARYDGSNVVRECAGQDLNEFVEKTEATLSCLDTLLSQLFVDRLHESGNLRL